MGRLADTVRRPSFKLGVKKERIAIDVAAQIEAALERRKITKTELAAKLGKSKAWVSKALHGKQNMTLATMVELAHALGCTVSVKIESRPALHDEKSLLDPR